MTDLTKVEDAGATPLPADVIHLPDLTVRDALADLPGAQGDLIHSKMIAVMRDLVAIGKDKTCAYGEKFNYRGIDQVYNAIHPLFSRHGVFMGSRILRKERTERINDRGKVLAFTTLHIRYRFVAEDGSFVETDAEGEGMDSGDKSSNKAMAVAHKYALLQAFCIPTEDMPDPDAEVHTLGAGETGQAQNQPPANPNAITTEQRDELNRWIKDSGATADAFCAHWKIEAVPDLPRKDYETAISMLKKRKEAKAAKAAAEAGKSTTANGGKS